MLAVNEARELLKRHPLTLPRSIERIGTLDAYGRILAEPIRADRDMPPYPRVMMDGYAIRFSDLQPEAGGRIALRVRGLQRAGDPPSHLREPGSCIEIMTGAALPGGIADTIVPYENARKAASDPAHPGGDDLVVVETPPSRAGEFVHARGADARAGDVLVEPGTRLFGPQIALAATVGMAELRVSRRPRVVLVSTGDELVPVAGVPEPHQIRMSNVPMLRAILAERGFEVSTAHLGDDEEAIRSGFAGFLDEADLILVSGGVSAGAYDHVPKVLAGLGVEKVFHKIRQRPGKPLWFGRRGEGKYVFGLPGNPVSTLMCFTCYVLPWIEEGLAMAADGSHPFREPKRPSRVRAVLGSHVAFHAPLDFFVPCSFEFDASSGRLVATPLPGNNSGDGVNLGRCQGFLHLPEGSRPHAEGAIHDAYLFTGVFP